MCRNRSLLCSDVVRDSAQRAVRRVRTQPKWKAGHRFSNHTEPERDRAMQMALPRKPAAKIGRRRNP